MDEIHYRKISKDDRGWIAEFIRSRWGSEMVVVHGAVYHPAGLEGFVAGNEKENVGLVTYKIENDSCEIVTLDAIIENKCIGSNLVTLVLKEAKSTGCKKVWLITTNDNIKAIYFYQKLGFQLVKIYPDAVENSRKIKPGIPQTAENGLPIRDELEFEIII